MCLTSQGSPGEGDLEGSAAAISRVTGRGRYSGRDCAGHNRRRISHRQTILLSVPHPLTLVRMSNSPPESEAAASECQVSK